MTKIVRYILAGIIAAVAIGVIVVSSLLVGSAIYGYRAATRAGNEAATLQNLKTIAAVETQYYQTHSRTFGTFRQLLSEQMLSQKFDGDPVTADGYVFSLIASPRQCKRAIVFHGPGGSAESRTGHESFLSRFRIRSDPCQC